MSVRVRILRSGEYAQLVVVDHALRAVLALEAAIAADPWLSDSLAEIVPAAETVLLVRRPGVEAAAIEEAVHRLATQVDPQELPEPTRRVEIRVEYAGPDLAEVARLSGLGESGVVDAHTGTPWRVAFGGFAPGFAYLVGGDPRLEVPRRSEPRTKVPRGAVGLAGRFSGIYPRESPGGWQLLGTTDAVLWDPDRTPPALLTPGTEIRFVAAP